MADIGSMTQTLQYFVSVASLGYSELIPSALDILQKFIIIELLFMGIFSFAFGETGLITATVVKKILVIGFYIYLIKNFEQLSGILFRSFSEFGLLAGGSKITTEDLFDPSAIINMGFECVEGFQNSIGGVFEDIVNPIQTIFKVIISFAILISYFIIALNSFTIILEFYLLTVCSVVLLPFGLFRPTAFLAEGAIAGAFRMGLKFMVFSFIFCMSFNILNNLNLPDSPTIKELFVTLFTVLTICWLCGKIPQTAANFISSSPNFSGPTASQIVIGGVSTVAGGAFLAQKITTSTGTSALRQAAEIKK
jgi:type IV secretion system protein TrbL